MILANEYVVVLSFGFEGIKYHHASLYVVLLIVVVRVYQTLNHSIIGNDRLSSVFDHNNRILTALC